MSPWWLLAAGAAGWVAGAVSQQGRLLALGFRHARQVSRLQAYIDELEERRRHDYRTGYAHGFHDGQTFRVDRDEADL